MAIKFMVERGVAGLFLDPGLGKTSIALAAFKVLKNKGIVNSMLVIAPLRVCHMVWPAEGAKWREFQGLKITVLHGKDKDDRLREEADVYLINPEGLPWLLTPENMRFMTSEMLVIDESTKFKHTNTKRFKLIRKWLPKFIRRYILTGTPAPNGLMDLFGQIFLLDLGTALGRYITHYRNEYFMQSGFGGYDWKPQHGSDRRIQEKISHLVLRLQAEDYLKLPELIYNTIPVEMPTEVRPIYKALQEEFIAVINLETVTALNAGAASLKLRQLANGGIYSELGDPIQVHDAKVDALKDLVEQLQGAPVLVFYQFKHDIERISRAFLSGKSQGKVLPYIGGGVSAEKGAAWAAMFNAGEVPILLAHPASAGHGLNLQSRSNHVVFFGPTWDLEHYDQSIRRVYRQGNPNTHIYVHHITMRDTVDDVIMQVLAGKDRTQQGLLNALKTAYSS